MRTTLAWCSGVLLVGCGLFAPTGCANSADDCTVVRNCGGHAPSSSGTQGGSGASGTGGDGGGLPAGCDPTKTTKPVASSCGVFVSSSRGKDTNGGSQSAPVKTFARALEVAKGKPIYACGEAFDEALAVSMGATIFGALDCKKSWIYDAGKPTHVVPSVRGPALVVSASDEVDIEDFAFTARDGSQPGESSIGAFIHDAAKVSLMRVDVEAGQGVSGENGSLDVYSFPGQMDLNGDNASGVDGGKATKCTCPGGQTTTGGAGGSAPPQGGGTGAPSRGGGLGGTSGASCGSGGSGGPGGPAPAAARAAGASKLGKLTAAGWAPGAGEDGDDGGPGQGGGGGTSTDLGGGGGGGCGGCGGAGAKHAMGGGSSIAVLVFNSSVQLAGGRLTAKAAGDGGKGVAGQPGETLFGFGGTQANNGCPGGSGGLGGDGGASGGGAGGVSAAVFYKGAKPTLAKAATSHGAAGKKGAGGDPGHNDGVVGQSGNVLQAP